MGSQTADPGVLLGQHQHGRAAEGAVSADGSLKYCEYAAVLARVVFGNREIFLR
jgi:hypothetical protein